MGLFFNQIKVLIKKDFWILKAHKKALIAEVVVPLLMALAAGVILHSLNSVGGGAGLKGEEGFDSTSKLGKPWSQGEPARCLYSPASDFLPMINPADNTSFLCPPALIPKWPFNETSFNYTDLFFSSNSAASEGYTQSYYTISLLYRSDPKPPSSLWLSSLNGSSSTHGQFAPSQQIKITYANIWSMGTTKIALRLFSLFNDLSSFQVLPADSIFEAPEANSGQLSADFIAIMMSLAVLPMVVSTAGRLVDEKRCKMREHLRVMGVRPLAYLLSTFGFGTVRVLLISIIMLVTFILAQHVIPIGDTILAVIVIYVFGHTMIAFSTLMPCFFSRSSFSTGAVVVFLMGGTTAAMYTTALPAAAQVILAFFFAPIAGVMGLAQALGRLSTTLPVSPAVAILFLVWQIFFYCGLSQYLNAVFPGEYGVSQHPLYPLYQIKRWFSGEKKESARLHLNTSQPGERNEDADGAGITDPKDHSIILKNLQKYYGSQRDTAAVDGLNLNIKRGEIFALLGHNGAGKTTTISMLTGMLEATTYETALVDGLDLEKDIDLIRHHICVCPQFDILYEDLSGQQHMEIFAALKSVDNTRGDALLRRLGLPLTDQSSGTFSGGMKRRLSVACAMVGGSPIVFLDEPSSGLDPMSRRQLWDMIREERNQGKTIILTTHFMEEADYLGERIAIMSHGRMYVCDTSLALKQNYGVGYYLTVVKEDHPEERFEHAEVDAEGAVQGAVTFDVNRVLELCQKYCPGATISQESLGDAALLLPPEHLNNYGDLLLALDDSKASFGISSYGIRMNSLEDVFVNISEKESKEGKDEDPLDMSRYQTDSLEATGQSVEELVSQASYDQNLFLRWWSQFMTICYKKGLYLMRSKRMWFLGIGVPLVMSILAWMFAVPISTGLPDLSVASGTNLPNYQSWEIPVIGDVSSEQQKILNEIQSLYSMHVTKFPGATSADASGKMSFKKFTYLDASLGGFIDTHSIAFDKLKFRAPLLLTFTNFSKESKELYTSTNSGPFPGTNVGLAVDDQKGNPFVGTFFIFLVYLARDAVANGGKTSLQFPNITTELYEPPKPAWVNFTWSTGDSAFSCQPNCAAFLLATTGIILAMMIAQYAGNAALQVHEEQTRHIYHTLRMHGMSSSAYWSATLFFDVKIVIFAVIAMTIGPYARGVTSVQNVHFLLFQFCVIIADTAWTLLSVYCLMCWMPNLKPNTYLSITTGSTMLLILVPIIIQSLADLWSSIPMSVIFPPRACVEAYLIEDATFFENPFAHKFGPGIVASMWMWCLVPLTGIWLHSTGLFRKRGTVGGSSPDGPSSINNSDSQPLLSANGQMQVGLPVDSDVKAEIHRIEAGALDDMCEGVHLKKIYSGGKEAVKDITFGIRVGECFGLLGPNGAGKTTTVKMLLKEHAQTNGAINYPYSPDISSTDLDQNYRLCRMGVCQQHDTLWESFTAEEHLHLYLKIRLGTYYKKSDWTDYIQNAIHKVYLEGKGKSAGEYSGGMKRKLAVAIALYTGAKTIFLDEPSTGMDPYARRAMWKSIKEALANDRCVLLTTHSMEEADAVCARIAIVTQGSMQCIGSGQHLKNKFGKGYSISLLLKAPENASSLNGQQLQAYYESAHPVLEKNVKSLFGQGAKVEEAISSTVKFNVPDLNIARAFKELSNCAESWKLESYSVNQVTSLEQIFLGFANSRSGADNTTNSQQ